DTVIRRGLTPTTQTLDVPWGKNLSGRQAILIEKLGVPDEAIEVLLDPRLFADRPLEEQRQALLKLLRPPTIDVPEAAKAIGIQSLETVQQVDDQIKSVKEGTVRSLNAVIKAFEETLPAEVTPMELADAQAAADAFAQLEARIQSLAL